MPFAVAPAVSASLGDWAAWYAAHGWPVFPCHGKAPVGRLVPRGFQDATTDRTVIRDWWRQWPNMNIGTPSGETWWALDVDARHDGPDTLRDLEASYGPLPRTVTSLTGSGAGSQHQLWAPGQRQVVNKAQLGDGLDVQGPGSYIILPPSIHPDTGQPYCWEADFGPDDLDPQPMPAWLEALVTAPTPTHSAIAPGGTSGGPILEGSRETTLMALAGAMRRQGATAAGILAALEAENQRCVPPLDQKDLARMARSAERYAPAPTLHVQAPPVGWSVNGVSGQTIGQGVSQGWQQELYSKKNGELLQNTFNIRHIFTHHTHWQHPDNLLWWDSVRGMPLCGDAEITDALLMDVASWFGGAVRLPITSMRMLEQCIIASCKKQPRDLLQLWLGSLEAWDGAERLTTWLTDIGGAEPGTYTAETSRVLLVSMVARAMHPGCHYRFVVIFEGAEELGKTTLVRTLASPEWYVELSLGLETKEAHMMLQGAWVAEFSDLDSLTKTEETRLKAFITMREDSYIPKYSNFRQRTERRAIFIGTTNEDSYLKGQYGNTRYLPIRLTHHIDLPHFRRIRNQLFAEALHYYNTQGEAWWQLSEAALETAQEKRELRRMKNVYEDPLDAWLEVGRFQTPVYDGTTPVIFAREETSWQEIARWFLRLDTPEKWKDRSLQMQITNALKVLGWSRQQRWKNGTKHQIWEKKHPPF